MEINKNSRYVLLREYPGIHKSWEKGDIVKHTAYNYWGVQGKSGVIHSSHLDNTDFWYKKDEVLEPERIAFKLVTEEGNLLTQGDSCFFIVYSNNIPEVRSYYLGNMEDVEEDSKKYKFFASKDNAHKHAVNTYPCLTLSDIMDFISKDEVTIDTLAEKVEYLLEYNKHGHEY